MFTLKIETENAAFEQSPAREVAAMLFEVRRKLMAGQVWGSVFDVNGNKVGTFELTQD